jgi:hypothetical protein
VPAPGRRGRKLFPDAGCRLNPMQPARARLKAERDYKARNDVQACTVCGRLFTRHVKNRVCSRVCLEKLEARQQANAK